MKRVIIFDIFDIVKQISESYGHLLKDNEPGWYFQNQCTPILKANQQYLFCSSSSIRRAETTGEALVPVSIENDEDGCAKLQDLIEDGMIFTNNKDFVCRINKLNKRLLVKTSDTIKSSVDLIEIMICITVCSKSKQTKMPIKMRDATRCFDLDKIRKYQDNGENNATDTVAERAIGPLVERLFCIYDSFFLNLMNFISQGDPRSRYSVDLMQTQVLVTEQPSAMEVNWDRWQEEGVLDKVIQYADKLMLDKNSALY